MSSPFISRIGGVISADIAVPDHQHVIHFYSRVLSTGDNPLWRDDLMNNLGIPIIGVGERTAEYSELPLQWMPHIQVHDIAASATRAKELGGLELLHGKDDNGNSQWAVLQDPTGAAFGLIPVVSPDALPETQDDAGAEGCIPWLELTVTDASMISAFYHQVVGWSIDAVEMTDAGERYADYNMLAGDGEPAAGICHARGVNQGVPPVWMIYLPVGDIAESVKRVTEEGGRIINAPLGPDGKYSYVTVEDPAGACVILAG